MQAEVLDVQVVTMANKGLGPNWLKPLTRYEVDATAEAEILSDLVRDCLRDHGRQHTATTSTTFIEGETTMLVALRKARSDKQIEDRG